MAVITIARELGAWSEPARKLLASRLGGTLIDKSLIEEKIQQDGFAEKLVERYDERKPGFFASFSADQDLYLLFLKSVMLEAIAAGPAVILGRCGNVLLGDLPNCLRVRLVAPLPLRIQRIAQEYQCDESTAAKLARKCDGDRAGFCKFHFNANWADPGEYDLTINTAKYTDEELVELLCKQLQTLITPEKEKLAQEQVKNRLLAQNVLKNILVTNKLTLAFLEVTASPTGRVILHGATTTPVVAKLAGEAAAQVPGVTEVDNRIRVAIELSHGRI